MTDLAIIIVNWNVKDRLAACLRTVQTDLAAGNLSAQIWVVDNASTDGSVAMLRHDFPDVHLIANRKNLGFAGGNNAALREMGFADNVQESDSPYWSDNDAKPESQGTRRNSLELTPRVPPVPVSSRELFSRESTLRIEKTEDLPAVVFLLNPDTEVHPGALRRLLDFLQNNPKAGIAGARLVYGDGSFQHSAFAFPGLWQLVIELLPLPGRLVESRLNGRYPRSLYEQGRPFRVGHPLGAAMCVRREAIQQVGLLDERYQMYVEEIDWSKRITSAGWEAYCVPEAKITHFGGQSTGQIKTSSFINLWASRYQFYGKHYSPLKAWLATQIVEMGMWLKAIQAMKDVNRGKLTQADLDERILTYDQVVKLWQGKEVNPEMTFTSKGEIET
jgi:N-acetylglucosaminyl-diphospho-decaprenol L-rhamnosyltransferase